MEEVGVVVGKTGTNEFLISLPKETNIMENEYVVVDVKERDKTRQVVGRIIEMGAISQILTEEITYEALKKFIDEQIANPKVFATVETLGYLDGETVKFPRNPPFPGTKVYRAPKDLLEEFYRVDKMPMHTGALLSRDDVQIHIDPRGFLRHLAIIAQTGGGKSYTAGVLIEELYNNGASVVIIDPHADYVRMKMDKNGKVIIPRFTIFRNPQSTGRYPKVEATELTISLKDLESGEISNIIGIPSGATRMRDIIGNAMDELVAGNENKVITFDDLYQKVEKWANGSDEVSKSLNSKDAMGALRYLKRARRRGISKIFSETTTPLDEIVKKKHIAVLDLSGLKNEIQDILVKIFLTKIYDTNTNAEDINPVFLVIEEAHNFVPRGKNTKSTDIIKRIAAEGRKFGVFLVIITQRPQKVDQDVLSQANSYIILRLKNKKDIEALTTAAESLSEDLSSLLPTLNPGEAVIVGPIIKVPGIVKIKERRTQEGGGDIDIISKLKKANKEVENESEEEGKTLQEIRDLMGE